MHKNLMLLKEIVWRSPDDNLLLLWEAFLMVTTHSISRQNVPLQANHSEKHWIKGSNKALEQTAWSVQQDQ